jgi:hypothetical protein
VKERPGDPLAIMWLGIRLQEFERTKQRINHSIPAVSVAGAVMRPILRPVIKSLATSISSGDGRRASQNVLSAAWVILSRRLAKQPPSSSDLCLMARNYLAGAAPDKAWELAAIAVQRPNVSGEAYYVLAEAMFDCGDHANARVWASKAVDHGCGLGYALQRSDAPFRRNAWMTPKKAAVVPTADDFWRAKGHYYEAVPEQQLGRFYGPSMISPEVAHGV